MLSFAHQLADLSGDILRRYFRAPLSAEIKPDRTPVTLADREAEDAMRRLIQAHFPDHGIVGEEYGDRDAAAEYCWVIDPIDGTRNFMTGQPIFGTLIALLRQGTPMLGIIDQPITRERWQGVAGEASSLNGAPIRTRHCARLEDAVLGTTSPYLFAPDKKPRFERVLERCAAYTLGGDCYAYAMLASGHLDIVVESGLKAHDVMALIPVIEGAGGRITDWSGAAIALGGTGDVLACGDPALHAKAVELLEAREPS